MSRKHAGSSLHEEGQLRLRSIDMERKQDGGDFAATIGAINIMFANRRTHRRTFNGFRKFVVSGSLRRAKRGTGARRRQANFMCFMFDMLICYVLDLVEDCTKSTLFRRRCCYCTPSVIYTPPVPMDNTITFVPLTLRHKMYLKVQRAAGGC